MAEMNTADVGFEKQIWEAACVLRGNIDASEYKTVILGLIFLKYISDRFEEKYQQLVEEGDGFEEDIDEYISEGIFFVPENARWSVIAAKAHSAEIGVVIDEAMRAIEKENKRLNGILPKNFARQELDKRRLGDVVDLFTNIRMIDTGNSRDVLGRTYEYCLSKFAEQEGKLAGEFYTPSCVVRTLVEVLQPYNGRVYDPCCGSGGMFVQSAKFIESHSGNLSGISVFGQDSNPTTWKLAQMNLAIRGIEANLGECNADTFSADSHPTLRADYILANPPFNLSDWGGEALRDDVRWIYGVPPTSNANYAWIQHMIHHLAPNGKIGLVLANTALTIENGSEYEIRQKLIENDLVECIVSLPAQLFYSTKIKVSLWFMSKRKSQPGKTLFIDARKLGKMVSRTLKEFTPEDINTIAHTVHKFQQNENYEDISGFCQVATTDDIRAKRYNISPTKYISGAIDADSVGDFEADFPEDFVFINDKRQRIISLKEKLRRIFEEVPSTTNEENIFSTFGVGDLSCLSADKITLALQYQQEIADARVLIESAFASLTQKLFKYWFVDFNFPNENGLPYADNGGKLHETPYGKIPTGWEAIQMGSILTASKEKVGDRQGVPEYSTTNRGVFPRDEKFNKSLTANTSKNKLVRRGDIVFGMSREIFNFGVMKDPIGGVSAAYHVYSIDKEKYNSEFLETYMRICDEYFLSLIKPGAREGQVLDKDELQTKWIIKPPVCLQEQYILFKKMFTQLLCEEI